MGEIKIRIKQKEGKQMSELEDLKKQLKELQSKKEISRAVIDKKKEIKGLKKQIKAERFAQTRGGKVFNAIGDFGLAVTKKIATPPKQTGKKKKTPARLSVEEIMARLPQ